MKKGMLWLFIAMIGIISQPDLFCNTQVALKTSDFCETSKGSTCVIAYSPGAPGGTSMTVKIKNMKSKSNALNTIDPTMLDTPFSCPAGYTEHSDYFIPDNLGTGTGLGVIGGTLYINENNPTMEFYYWAFDTSTIFDSYDEWVDEMTANGKIVE